MGYSIAEQNGKRYIKTSLRNTCEYLLTKDYTDNWTGEIHETFCFWAHSDWKYSLEEHGFHLHTATVPYANPWIVTNRFEGKAVIYTMDQEKGQLVELPYPYTHVVLIAQKR